jgi:hypothetical protein
MFSTLQALPPAAEANSDAIPPAARAAGATRDAGAPRESEISGLSMEFLAMSRVAARRRVGGRTLGRTDAWLGDEGVAGADARWRDARRIIRQRPIEAALARILQDDGLLDYRPVSARAHAGKM